jgi:hypothetical protein
MTQKEFDNLVWVEIGQTLEVYPKWLLREFCNHWGETNSGGRKMRWQKEKTFNIVRRMDTWKRNSMDWSPKKWKGKGAPMPPTKWMPTDQSQQAIEERQEIERGYERLKKIAKTKPKVEGNSLLKQHIINMSRPVIKKKVPPATDDYKKFKQEYLDSKKS